MSAQGVVKASLVSLGLCAGIVLIADGLHTPKPPPQPTAAQAFQMPVPVPAPVDASQDAPLDQPMLAPATPTRVRIPAINVNAPLTGLGLEAGRHLAAPPEEDRNLAGWYSGGTPPGVVGTAVIAGHVDTRRGPAVFYSLGALKRGDAVDVDRADGQSAVFTVDAVEAYDARAFPDDKVYGAAKRAELRLITCGAGFDKHHKRYSGNVVVYAHLTGVQAAPAGK
ncbi:class F sortase [Catenulispora subtropica]|uniref:Class F sortase n=2 Tax=Catenulispora subtropica TaxID=450798 RepID=A0ABP5DLZ6_9ACTN